MYSEQSIKKILSNVQTKKLSLNGAFKKLKHLPYEDLSFARLDHHRHIRQGLPEVIYAPGKSIKQMVRIVASFKKKKGSIIITRLEEADYRKLKKKFSFLLYSTHGKIAYYKTGGKKDNNGSKNTIAVITAGTGDIPVAEEAAITLEAMNQQVSRIYDCGVAGLHRLFDALPLLHKAKAIICIAGMEGALASVIAGLVERPVIAVPTSVGYGASFSGIAPLLTMLNSCVPGVAVVNIDNGFGAACFALKITD
ncbi:MAG: nickel pincer cofactor biosynthesis protein LarB [Candidatus Omnitrophica bacterium]|nr:nickel pincer cofactor biosynthesis protein LarB [Candidatus Omnitrophota bacterium]